MDIEDLLLWNHALIKVLDVRHRILNIGESLRSYKVPSSMFIVVTRGDAQVRLDNMDYHVQQFQIIHSGKGLNLDIYFVNEELEYYFIFYKASFSYPVRQEINYLKEKRDIFQTQYSFIPNYPFVIHDKVQCMYKSWHQSQWLERFQAKTLFYQIVLSIYQQLSKQGIEIQQTDLTEQIKLYIEEHYTQPIRLDSIADRLNYSVSHLSALFKKETSYSLIEYVTHIRMEKAVASLRATNIALKEIAKSVGYNDVHYFNRLFKKHTGMSPGKYRKFITERNIEDSPQNIMESSIDGESLQRYIVSDNHYQYKREEDIHMHRGSRASFTAMVLLCITLLLGACTGGTVSLNNETTGQNQTVTENQSASSSETRIYKDSQGTEVKIPTNPERIVLQGNAIGDLLALGIEPVGVDRRFIESGVIEDNGKINSIDIGFPTNLEKVLTLKPNLIMLSYVMDNEVEEASKIAPTVVFDGMQPLKNRLPVIADIVGKKEEGEQLLKKYNEDADAMWEQFRADGNVAEGETAVVFQFFWNKKMFVMKTGGVAGLLYQPKGFAMDKKVQALQPNSGPYIEITKETLHETLIGDHLFVLISGNKEAQKAFYELKQEPLWKTLPAVKNNKVHFIEDKWNYDDMTTSNMLLEEFPNMLNN